MIEEIEVEEEIKLSWTKKEEVKELKEVKKPEESRNKFTILRSKTLKPVINSEEEKKENKKEEKEEIKININAKKRYSTKYVFPQNLFFDRDKKRKVTITNVNELNRNRFEYIEKDILKRRTFANNELNI